MSLLECAVAEKGGSVVRLEGSHGSVGHGARGARDARDGRDGRSFANEGRGLRGRLEGAHARGGSGGRSERNFFGRGKVVRTKGADGARGGAAKSALGGSFRHLFPDNKLERKQRGRSVAVDPNSHAVPSALFVGDSEDDGSLLPGIEANVFGIGGAARKDEHAAAWKKGSSESRRSGRIGAEKRLGGRKRWLVGGGRGRRRGRRG